MLLWDKFKAVFPTFFPVPHEIASKIQIVLNAVIYKSLI